MTTHIAERLRAAADLLPRERSDLQYLVEAHRPQVREAVLVLFGALCLFPIPGLGTVIGIATLAMAATAWRDVGATGLPSRLGSFGLSRAWSSRVLRTLARLHELAASIQRPRLQSLVDRIPRRVVAATAGLMGVLIALPVPLGNLLPGLALVFVGMALLHRDGLALLVGAACALLGAAWPFAFIIGGLSGLEGLIALARNALAV